MQHIWVCFMWKPNLYFATFNRLKNLNYSLHFLAHFTGEQLQVYKCAIYCANINVTECQQWLHSHTSVKAFDNSVLHVLLSITSKSINSADI